MHAVLMLRIPMCIHPNMEKEHERSSSLSLEHLDSERARIPVCLHRLCSSDELTCSISDLFLYFYNISFVLHKCSYFQMADHLKH